MNDLFNDLDVIGVDVPLGSQSARCGSLKCGPQITEHSWSWCADPWSGQSDALKWPSNDLELTTYFAVFEILSFSYLVRINKNNIFSQLHY